MERVIDRKPVGIEAFGFEAGDWRDFVEDRLGNEPDGEDLRIIGELSRLPKEPFLVNHNTFGYAHIDGERLLSQLERGAKRDEELLRETKNERLVARLKASVGYYRLMHDFVEKRGRHAAGHLNRIFERREGKKR